MKLPDLFRAVDAALAAKAEAAAFQPFALRAHELASLTGWATGPIDPDGRAAAISEHLEQRLRERHTEAPDPMLAELHDALVDLRGAIASHDADVSPTKGGDESVDFE